MKRILGPVALFLGVAVFVAPTMASPMPGSIGLDLASQHVFRGAVVADQVSVQPNASFDVAGSGLGLALWGSFATSEREAYEATDRVDFTAQYRRSLGAMWKPLSFMAGYTEYTFPNGIEGNKHTGEAFVGVAAELPVVSASLTAYRDFNLTEVTYIAAGFSPPASFLSSLPIPGLNLNFNLGLSDAADSFGFNDFTSILSWELPLAGLVKAGPYAGFSYADETIDPENTNFWGGLSITVGQ